MQKSARSPKLTCLGIIRPVRQNYRKKCATSRRDCLVASGFSLLSPPAPISVPPDPDSPRTMPVPVCSPRMLPQDFQRERFAKRARAGWSPNCPMIADRCDTRKTVGLFKKKEPKLAFQPRSGFVSGSVQPRFKLFFWLVSAWFQLGASFFVSASIRLCAVPA